MSKNLIIILIVLVVIGVGAGVYFFQKGAISEEEAVSTPENTFEAYVEAYNARDFDKIRNLFSGQIREKQEALEAELEIMRVNFVIFDLKLTQWKSLKVSITNNEAILEVEATLKYGKVHPGREDIEIYNISMVKEDEMWYFNERYSFWKYEEEEEKLGVTYCPQENLPKGWSVKTIHPYGVEYSVIGEEASRSCKVSEYSTVDEAREAFDVKKAESIEAGVYVPVYDVGHEAHKAGGWVWIRVDNFVIFAPDPLTSAISEKIGKPEEKIEELVKIIPHKVSVYTHEELGFEVPVFEGWKLDREWESSVYFTKEYEGGFEAKLFVGASLPYVDTLQEAIKKHLRFYDPLEYEGHTTLAGKPAYEAIKDVKQKFGRWKKVWLVLTIHNNKDYELSFELTGDDSDSVHSLFKTLKPTFEEFLKGFKFIK